MLFVVGGGMIGTGYDSVDFGLRLGPGLLVSGGEAPAAEINLGVHFTRSQAPLTEGGSYGVRQTTSSLTKSFLHPAWPPEFGSLKDDLWIVEGNTLNGHVGWASKGPGLADRFPCHWDATGAVTLLDRGTSTFRGEATDHSGSFIIGFLRGPNVVNSHYWIGPGGSPQTLLGIGVTGNYPLAIFGTNSDTADVAGYADYGTQQVPELWAGLTATGSVLFPGIWETTWNGRHTDVWNGPLGTVTVGYRFLSTGGGCERLRLPEKPRKNLVCR